MKKMQDETVDRKKSLYRNINKLDLKMSTYHRRCPYKKGKLFHNLRAATEKKNPGHL